VFHVVSQRARVLRLRRTEQPLAISVAAVLHSSRASPRGREALDETCATAHNDMNKVNQGAERWDSSQRWHSRQCPACHTKRWNDGALLDADLYLQSLKVVYLNPYRKPMSGRQCAALQRANAKRAADCDVETPAYE
jgi:hypothetical protein